MASQQSPKVTELLSKAVSEAQRLATAQIALARTEMSESGSRLGKGAALGIAGAALIGLATIFFLFTLVYVLVQLGLPTWASFLIVTILLAIAAAIALIIARKNFEQVKSPTIAMAEFEKTRDALRGGLTDGTPAP